MRQKTVVMLALLGACWTSERTPVAPRPAPQPTTRPSVQRDQDPATPEDRIARGRELYARKGCISCHSVDGSPRVGPTWRGIWGTEVTLVDGSRRVVDEAYIEASLATPNAFARPGFPPAMPSFEGQLQRAELRALVAYIASLAK